MRSTAATREELEAVISAYGDDLPLDRVLLLIAREEYPDLDIGRYLGVLDQLGDLAARRARTEDLTVALVRTVFEDGGFRGNTESYYDPRNSLFSEVIDRRLGIPITLAAVFMEVARRAGSRALGIGFPGHFLLRHEARGRAVLLDPFNRGQVVRRSDCQRLLAESAGEGAELEPWMLEPSSPKMMVVRVLTNLKHAYVRQKDLIGAVKAIDRLLIVDPERWVERRDRGLLFVELECVAAALRDLEAYADHAAGGEDVEEIRRVLPDLRRQLGGMN